MKLLNVLPSVDPTGGGPMEAVLQSGIACLAAGHQVEVVTLDDPASEFVAGHPLRVHALGPTRGSYRYNPALVPWLKRHAPNYDAVVVHGLWQYHAFASWRALHGLQVPYFVFVHGMLDPWFKTRYPLKHLKKSLYWPWADYRLLRDARAVLFTCEEERLLARQSFRRYAAREAVVSFGTRRPPTDGERLRALFFEVYPHLAGRRLLLFLSRIHEKKGCDLLVHAFAKLALQVPGLHLLMAGPDQQNWSHELKSAAQQLGVADRIEWPGMLGGDVKWGAFHASEAFMLPSHQENFGIAVAEALGCGVPVLISDKVNIWREIAADDAGFVAPDTAAGTEHTLRRWLGLDPAAKARMALNARACFERRFTVEAMVASLLATIEQGVVDGPVAAR